MSTSSAPESPLSSVGSPSLELHELILFSGNADFSMPVGSGTAAPPLTSAPFCLSRQYEHYLTDRKKYEGTLRKKLASLRSALPCLAECQVRQAKADVVFLETILDGATEELAQARAAETWQLGRRGSYDS